MISYPRETRIYCHFSSFFQEFFHTLYLIPFIVSPLFPSSFPFTLSSSFPSLLHICNAWVMEQGFDDGEVCGLFLGDNE